jgi:DnaJ-class molecular chaperone
MADQDATPEEPAARPPCSACRGTGRVVSNLTGTPATVECPWCDGTGRFQPDHDAQAAHPHGTDARDGVASPGASPVDG